MSHLTLEALARLVDEAPDPAEESHLAGCPACGEELAALRDQTRALGTLPRLAPPPDAWPSVRRRLRQEGLVRRDERWWTRPGARRAAAAVLLFAGGAASGWAVRGPALAGPGSAEAIRTSAVEGSEAGESRLTDATLATTEATGDGAEAGSGVAVDGAEEQFLAALDRFMVSSGSEASDPAARLAALDNIVLTAAEALHEAPSDPVINSYFLMAQAQRQAVLRQIQASAGDPVF